MDTEKSECSDGYWLHDYIPHLTYPNGVTEICTRCKNKEFFNYKIPNIVYLESHIRSALQRYDKRFKREYPKLTK